MLITIPAIASGQEPPLSRTWVPAAEEMEPLRYTLGIPEEVPAEHYWLLANGHIAVRWNGRFLPARMVPLPEIGQTVRLEFDVPTEVRTPGLVEFVLWDMVNNRPLSYRGWVPVIIPTAATVFEADPARASP